jgi:DNA photolyase
MSIKTLEIQKLLDRLPQHLGERTWLKSSGGPDCLGEYVLYWTHHALRTDENPALEVAKLLSEQLKLPLLVYQGLSEKYRFASDRHHTFILEAARDLECKYARLGISYLLHVDRAGVRHPRLARLAKSSSVMVTDKAVDRASCASRMVSNHSCGYRLCGSLTLGRTSVRSCLCISRCNSKAIPRSCQPCLARLFF